MRCESEALHVRWTDVSFDERRITVKSARDGHRTKSGKSRLVPITDRLMTALRSHFEDHRLAMFGGQRTEYVIHHEATRRHHLAGKRVRSLRNSFKGAAERAELPAGFRQHDLRHRRVTTWIAAGHSIATIQMAMGHSDVRTTMGYCSLLPEHTDALLAEPSQRWQPNSPTMAMVR
jgi:integrase